MENKVIGEGDGHSEGDKRSRVLYTDTAASLQQLAIETLLHVL
jgi:hypothetical protein